MTIADYLNDLTMSNGEKLVWNKNKLEQDQLQQAGGNPYVILDMGFISPRKSFHGGAKILGRIMTLSIFVEPTETDHLPSSAEAERLWRALYLAPERVDEGLYGDDIIKLEYVGGFAPNLDERSSGLAAALRFDWWFTMNLKPAV